MATISEILPIYFKENDSAPIIEKKTAWLSEYELAQKAADGDNEAFEQIYWQYHRLVFGICMRMLQNVTEAEDLTQQVFLQLFRKISSFRGDSAFSTWLHRMTINQTLMYCRSKKSRKEDTTEDGELPEGHLFHKKGTKRKSAIDHIILKQAVAKLPKGYRNVLILHDIQGFDHEEIGKILGCAVGTSKSQLHKARMKIRRILAD